MRLIVHVEGLTEETFVDEVLSPHLTELGYESVSARLLGNARLKRNRGGITSWPNARNDIARHLFEDKGCFSTLLVDYYGLPSTGSGAWPGRAASAHLSVAQKAAKVQTAILGDLNQHHPGLVHPARFVPYVLMHEFEALLFSDCSAFAHGIERGHLAPQLQAIRDQFVSPEEINDSPVTAPSKRIQSIVEGYEKPLFGNLAALQIGLAKMRAECLLFNSWMSGLENLTKA